MMMMSFKGFDYDREGRCVEGNYGSDNVDYSYWPPRLMPGSEDTSQETHGTQDRASDTGGASNFRKEKKIISWQLKPGSGAI